MARSSDAGVAPAFDTGRRFNTLAPAAIDMTSLLDNPLAARPVVHHIPVCPFSQRLEILLTLKGCRDAVDFRTVEITKPRDPALLARTRGVTALPVLEADAGPLRAGVVLRESLVILRYLEMRFPDPPVARRDPLEHAQENLLVTLEGPLTEAGYRFVMNTDRSRRDALHEALLREFARLDEQLRQIGDTADPSPWVFDRFGWVEVVFTPIFQRFEFLAYYEGFDLPAEARFDRVRRWRDACVAHPAAQQVSREAIVKLYHDYARGAGNGALLPGRAVSSFALAPHWRTRPWPPSDKWGLAPDDAALGL